MVGTINWTEFDGSTFQAFCNDLLSFEIGKGFVPFIAPGADRGVDGLYEGTYNSKSGKWRFQAKFHHPDTGRTAGITQLRREIKEDLVSNIDKENYVIFLTNVEINPKRRKELIEIAQAGIQQKGKHVEFNIWDGAKINTLLTHHPIVKLWYVYHLEHVIQRYRKYFQDELNPSIDASYQLANSFYFRADKLGDLSNFIHSDGEKVAMVSGEAGIGKTRLCVEFFKEHIDQSDEWIALVLTTYSDGLEFVKKALTGEKNYVVLVDDADRLDPRYVADLITVSNSISTNKVKLLFTARDYFLDRVFDQVPTHKGQKIKRIDLTRFTKEETTNLLENELTDYHISELGALVTMTHGIPLMIVVLLKTIKSGVPLKDMSEDSYLKEYTKRHVNKFSEVVSSERGILKKDIEKTIIALALTEPVPVDDQSVIELVANAESIEEEEVDIIFQELKNRNMISGRYQYSIKPDMYSDLLLEEAIKTKTWLKKRITAYQTYISNIIKNVAYLQGGDEQLSSLLKAYINQIDTCVTYYRASEIINTVGYIAYSNPSLAVQTVEKVISIFTNEDHSLYLEFQRSLQHRRYPLDTIINGLKTILTSLFDLEDYYLFAYSSTGKLYEIVGDESLVSAISRFGKDDLYARFPCGKQNKILSLSKDILEGKKVNLKQFALKTLNTLLKLKFTDAKPHLYEKATVQIYTIKPEGKHVQRLRENIIELLASVFHEEEDLQIRDEILRILTDIPRGIFAARNKKYKGEQEIEMILNFLQSISLLNTLGLRQKQLIKEQLYWFRRWGLDQSYDEIINEISTNLSENDLAETLLALLNPKFGEGLREESWYKSEVEKIVDSSSAPALAEALAKIIEQSEYTPSKFDLSLNAIAEDLKKTRDFVSYQWEADKVFVANYCSGLLRKIRFDNKSEEFYWKYVEQILAEEGYEYGNCLLFVYHAPDIVTIQREASNNTLKQRDVDLIIKVFRNSTPDNYFQLAVALPTLFLFDKAVAKREIEEFLKVCDERHLDRLFPVIDLLGDEYYQEMKEFLFNHTIRLNISYSIERELNKIIKNDGLNKVLDYFERRFLHKRSIAVQKGSLLSYKFIPADTGNTIIADMTEEEEMQTFSKVLTWFVGYNFEPFEYLYATDLIEAFSSQEYATSGTKEAYTHLIKKHSSDYRELLNIASSLSAFRQKNEDFIGLIVKILDSSFNNLQDNNQIEEISTRCYTSLTSLGAKVGTPGQPFAEDLQLKSLIEKAIGDTRLKHPKVKEFLKSVLKSVQADIDREKDEGGGNEW